MYTQVLVMKTQILPLENHDVDQGSGPGIAWARSLVHVLSQLPRMARQCHPTPTRTVPSTQGSYLEHQRQA